MYEVNQMKLMYLISLVWVMPSRSRRDKHNGASPEEMSAPTSKSDLRKSGHFIPIVFGRIKRLNSAARRRRTETDDSNGLEAD
jgi:hypothetical protein